ncbi:hypothetical protein MMC30_007267 [Trapelia coarctata]|nr:hypothetical protein [Trapelia coarctata]
MVDISNLPHGLNRTKQLRESLKSGAIIPATANSFDKAGRQTQVARTDITTAPFWEVTEMTDIKNVQMFQDAFGPELEDLKNASPTVESSPTRTTRGLLGHSQDSPSQLLYGAEYAEVNRTIVGMLALKWLITDDYSSFTGQQEPAAKLTQGSFQELRRLFLKDLRNESDVYALLVSTVVNDLGKDPELPKKVAQYVPKYGHNPNHDLVAYIAAKNGLLPLIDEAKDTEYYGMFMQGLLFGSEVNIAQLAQAENVPGNLKFVQEELVGHEQTFALKFMELILDVAGAYGHIDSGGAKPMTEPVYQGYKVSRQALLDIINGKCSVREGYDQVLSFRAQLLAKEGYRSLKVEDPSERALLRLLTMGRTFTKDQAELFDEAFVGLAETFRQALVDGLSVDGFDDGVAIVLYYSPALFSETLKNTTDSPREMKIAALASLMRFFTRIYAGTKPMPGTKGRVVECSVAFVQDIIKGEEFARNPSVLDDVEIPEASKYRPDAKIHEKSSSDRL